MTTCLYTIGHSTRSLEDFVGLLAPFGVEVLADVRSVPRSAHNPQFDLAALQRSLPERGIRYLHLSELGGFRQSKPASVNCGWRNERFRGYADYMQTSEFRDALNRLIVLARASRTAIMCAEAVPWRCHRSLIGDALLVRGVDVVDIIAAGSVKQHRLTPFATVKGTDVRYPAPGEEPAR